MMRTKLAFKNKHGGKLPPELSLANLAVQTGWSYRTIKSQPASFINDVQLLLTAKTEAEIAAHKEQNRKQRKGK